MKKYIVKYKSKWILIYLCNDRLVSNIELHILEAKKIAKQINVKIVRSNYLICDYFGGISKIYDYSPYARQWILAS